jgi:hydrogenase-4 component B
MWAAQLFLTCLSAAMVPGTVLFTHKMTGGFATGILTASAVVGAALAAIAVLLVFVRRFLCPRGGEKPRVPVWDCGYGRPTARMAYTATAFTQPLVDFSRPLLRTRRHVMAFRGDPASPSDAAIATDTDDPALGGLWRPLFSKVARMFQRAHLLQNGSLHLYILIILMAVSALMAFALVS